MKKLYIDITQLYNWHGKVTGIQRVMYEISSRFNGDERFDPEFVMWHKNTASFYKIDFNEIQAALQESEKDTEINGNIKRRINYIGLFKRVYHHVPLSRTMYNVFSFSRGRVVKFVSPSKIVKIEPGSILFMPHGGVWESHTYIAEILRLHKLQDVKLVPILFDMCPIISPQFVVEPVRNAFQNYMGQVLPESDLVLAISNNTANDAKEWLLAVKQVDASNVKVFRLGDEVGGENPAPADVPTEFALCVGTIEARKNHTGLYYAYKLAAEQDKILPPLVIVGRKGWMSGDIYQLMTSDPEVKDKFIFLHNASDSQLAWLYENALFTVYPSFYEGWGLPIAESLLRGTPCLASSTSSMPEIAGNLVDYFSPYSPSQIAQKMELLNADRDLLSNRKKNVKKNYKVTSWDMSYQKVTGFLLNDF